MSEHPVQQKICDYIRENFLYAQASVELDGATDLLGSGILDSMGVVEVVAFLEQEFHVRVGDGEITEQNFGSPQAIASFVSSKSA